MRAPALAVGDGALGLGCPAPGVPRGHRTKVTKGPGSRAAGWPCRSKLIESAQARWRAVNAPHLVALVRAGARFERGVLVERPERDAA